MSSTPNQSAGDIFHPGGRLRLELLDPATVAVLRETLGYARATGWDCVRTPHLFMGLLAAPDAHVANWGKRLTSDLSQLLLQFETLFRQEDGDPDAALFLNREFLSDNVIAVLRSAYRRTLQQGRLRIKPIDLLIVLFTTPDNIVAECFERVGVPAARLGELAMMAEHIGGQP